MWLCTGARAGDHRADVNPDGNVTCVTFGRTRLGSKPNKDPQVACSLLLFRRSLSVAHRSNRHDSLYKILGIDMLWEVAKWTAPPGSLGPVFNRSRSKA